jgi:UDP-3-O-[3-hydroxymyristoyl] N-acetylglucosamine deacetylase/3-hydroxyacyl-[acyl-carrier-protein] dehydratase
MTGTQKTIKSPIKFTGRGLHTGTEVELTIQPASDNYGIQFCRTDLNESPVIRAIAENVVETSRGTTLEDNGVRVCTIEHVLAALSGLGIDNARIEVNGPEAPILDGSARFYTEGILKTGIKELKEPKAVFEITEKVEYRDDEHGVQIVAYPNDKLQIDIQIDYR